MSAPVKLTDARQLDWPRARRAAQKILDACDSAGYVPPEALDMYRALIYQVCLQMDELVLALAITPKVLS